MSQKIIAIFGATGNQGGAVLQALLKTGQYQIKAVTRSTKSARAQQLAALKNVSVVEADLDNFDSVDKALQGANGVFLVTDFTAHFVRDREIKQGKNVVDMAIKNGLQQMVFSGLENASRVINKSVYHFDEKAVVDEYGLKQADKINYSSIHMP
jgi:uncharacterized protein YbjT (DUF2867 family)